MTDKYCNHNRGIKVCFLIAEIIVLLVYGFCVEFEINTGSNKKEFDAQQLKA